MIALDAVRVRLGGIWALDGVDLRIGEGEQVALLGPSGAGKTTLMRVLNLAVMPDAGSYRFAGEDAIAWNRGRRRAVRATIATIHQRADQIDRLDAARNVLAGRLGRVGRCAALRLLLWPSRAELAQAEAALMRVGIADKLRTRADRLSGGQLQRLAIARALHQDARLILADEPVASLDPARAEAILTLLTSSARADQRTLVVNLHQPELARRFFARVVGLRAGRVVFDRPAGEVGDALLAALFRDAPVDELAPARASLPPARPIGV